VRLIKVEPRRLQHEADDSGESLSEALEQTLETRQHSLEVDDSTSAS
jgi:hypothetical protein